jgi:hypothetical protein
LIPLLETRHGIGGCSFIQVGDDPALDLEIYVDVHIGTSKLASPDRRLDAVIDFLGHAPADVIRLTAEVRRLRNELAKTSDSAAEGARSRERRSCRCEDQGACEDGDFARA